MKKFIITAIWTEPYEYEDEKEFYTSEKEYADETSSNYEDDIYVLIRKYGVDGEITVTITVEET